MPTEEDKLRIRVVVRQHLFDACVDLTAAERLGADLPKYLLRRVEKLRDHARRVLAAVDKWPITADERHDARLGRCQLDMFRQRVVPGRQSGIKE